MPCCNCIYLGSYLASTVYVGHASVYYLGSYLASTDNVGHASVSLFGLLFGQYGIM